MKTKKWLINLLLGVTLMALMLVLCGFTGNGYNCGDESGATRFGYELKIGSDFAYDSTEEGTGENRIFTVYVPMNRTVTIPLKAVLTPEPSVQVSKEWKFDKAGESVLPDGFTLGETSVTEEDGRIIVTADVTIEAQSEKLEFGEAKLKLVSTSDEDPYRGDTLDYNTFTLKVVGSETCYVCGGELQEDFTYAHKACEICGGLCDGTAYEHKTCEICKATCDGHTWHSADCGSGKDPTVEDGKNTDAGSATTKEKISVVTSAATGDSLNAAMYEIFFAGALIMISGCAMVRAKKKKCGR